MVRTKADNCARKAVAAKAPRKALGGGGGGGGASNDTASPSGKGGKYAGGNFACERPTPDWQKGIGGFLVERPVQSSADGASSQEAGRSASETAPLQRNGLIDSDEDE